MQTEFRQRLSHGMQFLNLNYTLAKSLMSGL